MKKKIEDEESRAVKHLDEKPKKKKEKDAGTHNKPKKKPKKKGKKKGIDMILLGKSASENLRLYADKVWG